MIRTTVFFVFVFSILLSMSFSSFFTIYSGTLSPTADTLSKLDTDVEIVSYFNSYPDKNTRFFIPKKTDEKTPLLAINYMCPGKLKFEFWSKGEFHIKKFSAVSQYYFPIKCNKNTVDGKTYTICSFACDCSTRIEDCMSEVYSSKACRLWVNEDGTKSEELLNPHPITFISGKTYEQLSTLNLGQIRKQEKKEMFDNFSKFFKEKRELANLNPAIILSSSGSSSDIIPIYPNHKVYSTIFLAGEVGIEKRTSSSTEFITEKIGEDIDGTTPKYTKEIFLDNNQQDTFNVGKIQYRGQIYTFRGIFKPNNYLGGLLPLPIDQDFSTIFILKKHKLTLEEAKNKIKQSLIVYVVEPKDCSEIEVVAINPTVLENLKENKPVELKVVVSSPYELFGMKATKVKAKNPSDWKVEPIDPVDFAEPFSSNEPKEIDLKITPTSSGLTTISSKDKKFCFTIEFESDTPFCDGSICTTSKEVCVTYSPTYVFSCALNSNITKYTKNTPTLFAGESAMIFTRCYVNKVETICPSPLTWSVSGFTSPPSKQERVSLTLFGTPKPPPFSNKPIQTLGPIPLFGKPHAIFFHTYSSAETIEYGVKPTPSSTGKITVSGNIDGEEFICHLPIYVIGKFLPDLVPIVEERKMSFEKNNPIYPIFSFRWGVRNEKFQFLKPKDSPLSPIPVTDDLETENTDITQPFKITLYLYDPNTKNYAPVKTVTVNGLKAGESFMVEQFSYACNSPYLRDALVVVDDGNSIVERNEENNKQLEFLNCIYRMVCPDFV
ncbi:MAG: hypothetical protein N3D10_00335 [Candidatus Micrarchaeota archaeon]|nr:hypothetical protein [Candidatus Micrarchaeota archaeon]